jgi:ABC-type sugar transport system ATPase subunit
VGRAIVRNPRVFLFDEPLSNLDAKLRAQTRVELLKLHRQLAATSVYVTHDQVEAMTLAQRMVVMNAGRAEQIGTPMEVYQNPATVFVAGFIGSPAMNFIEGKSEGDGRIQLEGSGILAVPKAPASGRKLKIGIRPEHLTPSKPSEANLVGSVEVIEALGADTLIHVAVAGHTIIARLPNGTPAEVGEPIALAADRERIYLFDAETGARLPS